MNERVEVTNDVVRRAHIKRLPLGKLAEVIFIALPDFDRLEELYDARNKARTNLEEYMQKISRMSNNAHHRLAIIDWMDVLSKESSLEQDRVESDTGSQGRRVSVGERLREVRKATRAQIARAGREEAMEHTVNNPYNRTIIHVVRLGNRLERAERDILRFPYTGRNRSLHSDIPSEAEIGAQALGAVANSVQKFYRDTFLTPRKST